MLRQGMASGDGKNACGRNANLGGKNPSGGFWWARKDLNLGPMDYESTALTAELRARSHGEYRFPVEYSGEHSTALNSAVAASGGSQQQSEALGSKGKKVVAARGL